MDRPYRAGQSIQDQCRQCHEDRTHTIVVVDAQSRPIRVRCDYCGSEHNFRGGPRGATAPAERGPSHRAAGGGGNREPAGGGRAQPPEPLVSPREGRYPLEPGADAAPHGQEPGDQMSGIDIETLLRKVIREEAA